PLTAKSPPQIRQTRERRDNCKHEQWDPETAEVSGESNSCYESAGACDRCNDNEEPRLVRACDDRREEDCIPASPLNPPFTLLAATVASFRPSREEFEAPPVNHRLPSSEAPLGANMVVVRIASCAALASARRLFPHRTRTTATRRAVEIWSGCEDLNLRPPAPKAGALPGAPHAARSPARTRRCQQ